MTHDENNLLQWLGDLSGAPDVVHHVSAVLFASGFGHDRRLAHSALNNDGSPIQICVTYDPSSRKIRIIGDPAAGVDDNLETRFFASKRALSELVALTGSNHLENDLNDVVRLMLPSKKTADLQAGFFWLAAGLDGGIALYVNTRWGNEDERWHDAVHWLDTLVMDPGPSEALVRTLIPNATLVSVGIEGQSPENARAKLYWRLKRPVPLLQMGIPILADPAFDGFLRILLSDGRIRLAGLVFSASFRVVDGNLYDVKIDVCSHCLTKITEEWVEFLEACCRQHGLLAPNVRDGLLSGKCELAFAGLGLDTSGNRRLNTYLKAPSRRPVC